MKYTQKLSIFLYFMFFLPVYAANQFSNALRKHVRLEVTIKWEADHLFSWGDIKIQSNFPSKGVWYDSYVERQNKIKAAELQDDTDKINEQIVGIKAATKSIHQNTLKRYFEEKK